MFLLCVVSVHLNISLTKDNQLFILTLSNTYFAPIILNRWSGNIEGRMRLSTTLCAAISSL